MVEMLEVADILNQATPQSFVSGHRVWVQPLLTLELDHHG